MNSIDKENVQFVIKLKIQNELSFLRVGHVDLAKTWIYCKLSVFYYILSM